MPTSTITRLEKMESLAAMLTSEVLAMRKELEQPKKSKPVNNRRLAVVAKSMERYNVKKQ